MIHPSYFELMDIVNKDVKEGEEPVIRSRYSIVIATAKRARQIIEARHVKEDMEIASHDAANKDPRTTMEPKPLSIAVDELKNGDIHIVPGTDEI